MTKTPNFDGEQVSKAIKNGIMASASPPMVAVIRPLEERSKKAKWMGLQNELVLKACGLPAAGCRLPADM
jgi:hypothetical protein